MWQYISIVLLSLCGTVRGYDDGAPSNQCDGMRAKHNADAQTKTSPYTIHISANQYACGGEEIQVTINGTSTLQGFLCQPRTNPNRYQTTGSLTISGPVSAWNNCGEKAALTQRDDRNKQSVSFVWKSSSATDNVFIVCTIVKTEKKYWLKQTSSMIEYTTGRNCTYTGSASTFSMTSSLYATCILLLGIYFISMTN